MKHSFSRVLGSPSLKRDLALAFVVIIALALIAGAVSLASQSRYVAAVRKLVEIDGRIDDLSDDSIAAVLKARRAEKDFLLFRRELGFAEARSRYVTLVRANDADIREYLEEIRELVSDSTAISNINIVGQALNRYEAGFLRVVDLYEQLGRMDTGVEGRLRRKAREMEQIIRSHGLQRLLIDLLTLRQEENNFISWGLQKHANGFESAMQRFRADLAQAGLAPGPRVRLGRLASEYLELFRQYVRIDALIEGEAAAYLGAAHTIEPALETLHNSASRARIATRDGVLSGERATIMTVAAATAAAALLALAVALVILRSTNRSVAEGIGFAERIAGGDFTVRMPPGRWKEFRALAGALNRMIEALEESRSALEQRAAELAQANALLRREIADRKQANELLRLSNRAIECSVNAVLITSNTKPGDPIEYVNPAFERITGYSAAEVLGRNPEFLRGGDHDQPGVAGLQAARRERREAHVVLRNYRKDGSLFWNDLHLAPVTNETGDVTHSVVILNDVTEAKNYERQLERQANHDALTDLANRNLLGDRLQQALDFAQRRDLPIAVAIVDLDHFKLINDGLGHGAGDEMLKVVAGRMKSCVRKSDTVARLGGDEFAVVLSDLSSSGVAPRAGSRSLDAASVPPRVIEVMQRMLSVVSEKIILGDHEFQMTCSIGVSIYPQDGANPEVLLKNADAAMYRAKELGRNNFQFYTAALNARTAEKLALQAGLRRALERQEFSLAYQVKVSLDDCKLSGIEALLRWNSPDLGHIAPSMFIPVLEESGLVIEVGRWVMEKAMSDYLRWTEQGLQPPRIAVNVSAVQLRREDFVGMVEGALAHCGGKTEALELEITESLVMENIEENIGKLRAAQSMGIQIAVDDFGTGYSSLAYIAKLPINSLKIDRAFIVDMVTNTDSMTIVSAIITLAHSLGLKVVAEGVETEDQARVLRRLKCDQAQGYLFAKPVASEELERILRTGYRSIHDTVVDLDWHQAGRPAESVTLGPGFVDCQEDRIKGLIQLPRSNSGSVVGKPRGSMTEI